MSRQNLTATKGGINRLRVKGSPSPDTLFDALNCYIDAAGDPVSRPGTTQHYALANDNAKGLATHDNGLVTFSHVVEDTPQPGLSVAVLVNPNDAAQPLKEIHFAADYMGFLYVAAEFQNGETFHYWLQRTSVWQPDTVYFIGDVVEPTTPTGLAYRANRIGEPGTAWAPNVERAIGDEVEPTEYNGYRYEVIEVYGATPRSGTTEPVWPESVGGVVTEDTDGATPPPGTGGSPTDPSAQLPKDIKDRYSNPSGNTPTGQAR